MAGGRTAPRRRYVRRIAIDGQHLDEIPTRADTPYESIVLS